MADPDDVATLAAKLRGKGLSDDQVREGLRGMGFSSGDAQQAVTSLNPAPAAGPTGPTSPRASKPASKRTPAAARSRRGGGSASPSPKPSPPAGATFAPPSIPTPDLSSITLTPPRKPSAGDLGGFAAGLLLYALALSFLRYGPAGPKAWLMAKFLNRPMTTEEAREAGVTGSELRDLTTTKAPAPAGV